MELKPRKQPIKKRLPIILCFGPNGRGVLYGYVDEYPTPFQPVTLYDARIVLYWSVECGGLLGLAESGPRDGTRLSGTIVRTTETVWQECAEVSTVAAGEMDTWPTYRG